MEENKSTAHMDPISVDSIESDDGLDHSLQSLAEILRKNLGPESEEAFNELGRNVRGFFARARTYIDQNPREAMAVAATAGLATYVLLYTKPGRPVLAGVVALLAPRIKAWVGKHFPKSANLH